MARAVDVANFFIDYYNSKEDDCLTHLALQKLLYFAQGLSLARTGKELFAEEIEAWTLGPVVPAIYHEVKNMIATRKSPVTKPIGEYDAGVFSEEEYEVLLNTLYHFGKYQASALVDISHKPNGAWDLTNKEGKETISKDLIKRCFVKDGYRQIFFEDTFANIPAFEGAVNADGEIVPFKQIV